MNEDPSNSDTSVESDRTVEYNDNCGMMTSLPLGHITEPDHVVTRLESLS